jgi:hypothetical protein
VHSFQSGNASSPEHQTWTIHEIGGIWTRYNLYLEWSGKHAATTCYTVSAYCDMSTRSVARQRLNKEVLLGNGDTRNNRRTVGNGVFYLIPTEVGEQSCSWTSCERVASQQRQVPLSTEAVEELRIVEIRYQATATWGHSELGSLSVFCSDLLSV